MHMMKHLSIWKNYKCCIFHALRIIGHYFTVNGILYVVIFDQLYLPNCYIEFTQSWCYCMRSLMRKLFPETVLWIWGNEISSSGVKRTRRTNARITDDLTSSEMLNVRYRSKCVETNDKLDRSNALLSTHLWCAFNWNNFQTIISYTNKTFLASQ